MPFAGIAFLWFVVALRMWIKESSPEDALFFAAAAAESVLAVTIGSTGEEFEVSMARQFPHYGSALLLVFAMRMASVFAFTTSTIGLKHQIMPRWFIWAGYVVGLVLLLSATISPLLILVFPVWVLILSLILLMRARSIPDETTGA